MGVGRAFCIGIVVLGATACGRIGYPVVRRDASIAADVTMLDVATIDTQTAALDSRDGDRSRDAEVDVIDTSIVDAAAADSSATDATSADATVADASVADASVADATVADASVADASVADASVADASVADASVADAARPRVLNAVRVFEPPGVDFRPSSIATDLDGNVYLAATINADQDFGGGTVPASALVLASYEPSGAFRWQRVLRSTVGVTATRVSATGAGVTGAVLLTGSAEGTVTVPSSTPLDAAAGAWMGYSVSTTGVHRHAHIYPGSRFVIGDLAADATVDIVGSGGSVDLGLGVRAGQLHVARFDAANTATMHQTITWSGSGSLGARAAVRFLGVNTLVAVNASGQIDFGAGAVGSGTLTSWGFVAEYTPTGVYLSHREFSVAEEAFSSAFVAALVAENDLRCILVAYQGTPLSFTAPIGTGSFVDCLHLFGGSNSWSVPFRAIDARLYGSRLVLAGSFSGELNLGSAGLFNAGANRDTIVVTYEISSGRALEATHIESPASDDFPIATAVDLGRSRLWVLADYEGEMDLNGTVYNSGTRDHAWLAWVALPP